MLSHRLTNAFDLHYIHTIMSLVVVLGRNIKYLASSQQEFSCDKALSTLYDQKKNPFTVLHKLTLCIPETPNENFCKPDDPKIYPHTKFRIPTSNYIQISSELDLARTETRGQGHSDLETFGDSPGSKMHLHTKY